jgi:biotin carboxylase
MKILILGTGHAQTDAIQYLKENGHTVYATSCRDDETGRHLADHFEIIDILDESKTADFVSRHAIDLVYSVGSDIAMPTIGYVSEKLKLPCFVNEKTARLMQNKDAFRNFLKSNRFCDIRYQAFSSAGGLDTWTSFPAVVKPVDSQGQRGIFEVSHPGELRDAFRQSVPFSRSGTVIVENYIQGIEVSVNSYLFNGQFLYHFISKRDIVADVPGGIAKAHSIPACLSETVKNKLTDLIETIIKKLSILNGPVYFQVKVTPDDEIYIIEGTPRLDGCHLWRLILAAHGVNLLDITFKHLLGLPRAFKKTEALSGRMLQLVFFHQRPGSLFNALEYETALPDCPLNLYYKNGDVIRPVNGHYEKVGYYII